MQMGLGRAAILGTNRKSIADFTREEEEFNARKKQRAMAEQMGELQLQQTKRDLATPAERFGGNNQFSLIANVAYKDALAKTGDPDLAEKMAINTALKSKPQWTIMPDPSDPYAPPILRQTVGNPVFDIDDPMAASQAAIGQRRDDIGANPNQLPEYRTGGFNPDADLQVKDMNEADVLAAIEGSTPLNTQGVMDAMQSPQDMTAPTRPSVPQPNIDPRAMGAHDVQKDVAKDFMKLPAEQQRLQMQTQQKLMEDQALAEQKKQRENQEKLTTYKTFDIGIKNIEDKMSETMTNPITGNIPAMTPAQQGAEGSVKLLAPIMKQLFRSAGEGTFTDKDQDMLMGMLPTRTDYPSVRKQKIEVIKQVVAVKLGIDPQQLDGVYGQTNNINAKSDPLGIR